MSASSPDRPLIIAEAGVNHNGSLDMALRLVDAAAEAGVDVVKFQTFKTEKVIARHAPKARYQTENCGAGESQFEMVRKLELDGAAFQRIAARCAEAGVEFLSTPFDEDSLDLLVRELPVKRLKIPSGEITNAPLLLRAARSGLPLIVSTGMASLGEIEAALGVIAFGGIAPLDAVPGPAAFAAAFESAAGQGAIAATVTLLHCTSEYPAPLDEVNLRAMDTMRRAFGLPVGYSDHTEGIAIPVAAAALGAVMIEKHYTLDRTLPGPDHRASLEPAELKAMVAAVRAVGRALGSPLKRLQPGEADTRAVARKSLVAAVDIPEGAPFTVATLTTKRPGTGLSPFGYWDRLGRPAGRAYAADEMIES
ncbi:MAG: N-acetylneuraminate synthase [Rhodospirillaceae bacterium]